MGRELLGLPHKYALGTLHGFICISFQYIYFTFGVLYMQTITTFHSYCYSTMITAKTLNCI